MQTPHCRKLRTAETALEVRKRMKIRCGTSKNRWLTAEKPQSKISVYRDYLAGRYWRSCQPGDPGVTKILDWQNGKQFAVVFRLRAHEHATWRVLLRKIVPGSTSTSNDVKSA